MTRQTEPIEFSLDLPEGAMVVRAVEVVQFLHTDGTEGIACRWQGTGNILIELGMCEYAKMEIANERWAEDDDESEESEPQ